MIPDIINNLAQNYIYFISIILFLIGLWGIIINDNLLKKLLCLGIFQNAILLFFVAQSKIKNGIVPMIKFEDNITYSNPVPQVLMLTAIVVALATLSVGISMIFKIKKNYNTLSYKKIKEIEAGIYQ